MDMGSADSFRTRSGRAPAAGTAGVRLLTLAELEEPAFLAAWERLALRAAEPNPFFEPWYLLPSLRQWGAEDGVRVKVWFHDGRLAGVGDGGEGWGGLGGGRTSSLCHSSNRIHVGNFAGGFGPFPDPSPFHRNVGGL